VSAALSTGTVSNWGSGILPTPDFQGTNIANYFY
jgi:hypothetical protein